MKRTTLLLTLSLLLFSYNCSKVPLTGRRQVNFLPENVLLSMSLTNYRDFLKENPPVPKTDPTVQSIDRSGKKIAAAVEKFLKENNQSSRVKDFSWEFNMVNNSVPNAWCMPGGKVVVYSGILPYTDTEAGMACVLGHEIAHAVARHGNERLSQQLLVAFGAISLEIAMKEQPQKTKELFNLAYGAGSTLGTLAYSRSHESEADELGMIFMAMAGYNPAEAITFWERMAKAGSTQGPEFLSTHPSNSTRITKLKKFLPEAMKHYKP
jgi:predicted Zn-dependent protease